MNAEILCVGTELLLGDVVNTNAAEAAKVFASLGINVYHHEVVGDNGNRLMECLKTAFTRSDIVLLTGGLGPTYDDLTKETAAAYFGKSLVMNEEYLKDLEHFFTMTGRKMTDNNKKQAMMPEGAIFIPNPNGTAPGCIIEDGEKAAILLPGPPREMVPMMKGFVKAYLEKKTDCVLVSEVLNIFGMGEAAIEDILRDIMTESKNPTVAPYAKQGECQVRITARAKTKEEGLLLISPIKEEIRKRFPGGEVYGENKNSIFEALIHTLRGNGHTVACAESLTGGIISSTLVNYAGVSDVLKGSAVTYSNDAKMRVLGVKEETINLHGAVSKECAMEMAENTRRLMGADIGISTTGNAGPTGSEGKPVGLVYAAVSSDLGTEYIEMHLARGRADDRETVRYASSCRAAFMAIKASEELTRLK